ncbi:MAG: hypothetical protein QGG40_14885, partial [Myxococcota bacterium]|nr:hypothetical protein [Myxococcota bacterium]
MTTGFVQRWLPTGILVLGLPSLGCLVDRASGEECAGPRVELVDGECQPIGGSGGDTDTDADADTDSDADTDT